MFTVMQGVLLRRGKRAYQEFIGPQHMDKHKDICGGEGPEIINSAVQRLEEIENRMSVTIQDSDVSREQQCRLYNPLKFMKIHLKL